MKFHELISSVNYLDVLEFLVRIYYPDEEPNLDADVKDARSITGIVLSHLMVFMQLKEMEPVPDKMRICVQHITYDEIMKKECDYYIVDGMNGTTNRDQILEEGREITDDMDENFLNAETGYAIEFTSWKRWLGMDIDKETLEQFSPVEIVAHCLNEMTVVSYDEDEIKNELDKLKKQVEDIKSGKAKTKSFSSVKEMMKEMGLDDDKIND